MIYSPSRGVLFTHVSRTGGTTITSMLKNQLPDIRLYGNQHLPILEARNLLGYDFENAYKFSIVRNPWDRFVSWYALIGQTTFGHELSKSDLSDPQNAHWGGFDNFLESWSTQEVQIEGVSRKALSQWGQLSDKNGRLIADRVGRFETFHEDVSKCFLETGLSCPIFPILNSSLHLHYSAYYSNFGRELVEHIYKEDVTEFNYRFEYF